MGKGEVGKGERQEEQLKERYKLLDQRLVRLRKQFVPRKGPQEDEEEEEFKNKKKFALQSYTRYSPLTKLLKINEKLRREEERSLSQTLRKRKESSTIDEDKPKWNN